MELAIESVTKYTDQAVELLLPQYKHTEVIRAFVEVHGVGLDLLRGQAFEIMNAFDIDTAVGDQLDIIGATFAEDRLFESDDDYRQRLYIKIFKVYASGTREDVLSIIRYLSKSDCYIVPSYPKAAHIFVEDSTSIGNITNNALSYIVPAGTETTVYSYDKQATIFKPSKVNPITNEATYSADAILPTVAEIGTTNHQLASVIAQNF